MSEEKQFEEKQIEEIARDMCSLSSNLKCCECSDDCQFKYFAKRLYDKDYSKHNELEFYLTQIEKHLEVFKEEKENLRYKQILCELLLFLRGYYEDRMIMSLENDITRLEYISGHEIECYYSCKGFFVAYSDIVSLLRSKILPEEVTSLLLF